MLVNMTLQVVLELPDGSASMDGTAGRGWVLPNGDFVKPYVALELNDKIDLPYHDILALGCDLEDMITSVEIGE